MGQRSILYFVFSSLILILGIVFLWLPKYQELNNLKLEIKDKEIDLQNKEQYFQRLEKISEQLKEHQAELAKIKSALPSSPEVLDILNFLAKTASESGLILDKISLGETTSLSEESEIKKTQLSFSLAGSYLSLKNFLSSLQKNSRLIAIEEISFQVPKEGEIFSFNLRIRTYSY